MPSLNFLLLQTLKRDSCVHQARRGVDGGVDGADVALAQGGGLKPEELGVVDYVRRRPVRRFLRVSCECRVDQ